VASGLDQNRVTDWLNATIGESCASGGAHTAVLATAFSGSASLLGHIRLMTTNGSSTVNGTELSGGSYVQGTGVQYGAGTSGCFSAAAYSPGAGSTSNGTAVSQAGMPAATIQGIEIWDSAGTAPAYAASNRWWWGALSSPVTTNNGDTLTFAISAVTVSLVA
jgi:hypothetical protein